MFNLQAPELLIILVILLLIFGAGRVAELGGALGRSIREFKKAQQGLDEEPATKTEPAAPATTTTTTTEKKA